MTMAGKYFKLLLAAALVFGMAANVDAAKKRTTKSKKTRTTAAAPAVTKGETKEYGDALTTQMFTVKKDETQISVEYPISGNPELVQAIRSQIAKDLLWDSNEDKPISYTGALDNPEALLKAVVKPYNRKCTPFGDICQTLEMDITVIYSNDAIVTIGEKGYWYGGGAHGLPLIYGYTFLKSNGEELTNDMLPDVKTVRTALVSSLCDNAGIQQSEFSEVYMVTASDLEYSVSDAYVDANGLNFQYSAYEICPYAFGTPKATIPFEAARAWLSGTPAAEFLK